MGALIRFVQRVTGKFRQPGLFDLVMLVLLFLIPVVLAVLFVLAAPGQALPLSPGDRVLVTIPEGEGFSGGYIVNSKGDLELSYVGGIVVAGLEPEQAEQQIRTALIQGGIFQPGFIKVSMQVLAWAPIQVAVAGAVYAPGRTLINSPSPTAERKEIIGLPGDANPERYLSAALRGVGGITPYADIQHVKLLRGQVEQTLDLTGLFTGDRFADVPLVAGDQIIVPKLAQFQAYLVRPSVITIPGMKVFVSNLTVPATSNASSGVNGLQGGISMSYGARLTQAEMAGNCAGGTAVTNSSRFALLLRTDRLTGQTTVLERPIEDLLRKPNTDLDNPLLLPDDAVACYDSVVTNVRDVFRSLGELINPLNFLFGPNSFFNR